MSGRAYAFMRWSGVHPFPGILGEVGWAFEYNDRLGRFHCFYCGSTEASPGAGQFGRRLFWYEKCLTLPELIKVMSSGTVDRPAFDEVKVFAVEDAQSEVALQMVNQLSAAPEEVIGRTDPLEHAREILTRYGVRSLAHTHGFNAPFLWYNLLPGRSVPARKLAVHLFQLRASETAPQVLTPADVEDRVRKIAQNDAQVSGAGECFVSRNGAKFIVGLNIAVNSAFSVGEGRNIAERVEQAIRTGEPHVSHVFIQVEPFEKLD
ncbi:MAG TPA: cation transporter dimerization domain-containing protein [Bryobacteraceae bacterium]|nr:cation transporter dimerization domain-containing protein [Bryobacteraceae bacterium]